MGDGRYYSVDQFFAIIILTILIVVSIVALMMFLFKLYNYKKQILVMGGLLCVSLIASFIAEVTYSESSIVLFNKVANGSLYLFVIVNFVFRWHIKEMSTGSINAGLVSLGILSVLYILEVKVLNLLYLVSVIHFIVFANKVVRYRISAAIFSRLKKLILDYVFIVSLNGDVIFKNQNIVTSELFKKVKWIDIENIEELFSEDVIIRNAFSKQFIKVKKENTKYLQLHKKELLNKGVLAGYILTFVDITELVDILDELSEKQRQIAVINEELNKYKEIVYDIEKEKEINVLLDKIAENQHSSMLKLKSKIECLDITDEGFESEVQKLTEKAKADLKSVRNAVNEYMIYYE